MFKNEKNIKMKYVFIVLVCYGVLGMPIIGFAQFQNTTLGGDDFLFGISDRSNGEYYMATGYSKRTEEGFDMIIQRIDASGSILWEQFFGGSNDDFGYQIIDGHNQNTFLSVGSMSPNSGTNGPDVMAVYGANNGDVLYTRTYGGTGWDQAYDVALAENESYVIVGRTTSEGAGDGDAFCMRINKFGDLLWSRAYGGTKNEDAQQIAKMDDGGYMIVGHTETYGAGNADMYVMKISDEGFLEWTKTFGSNRWEYANAIQATNDGNFLIAGQTNSFGFTDGEMLLLKIDPVGDLIWVKTYGGSNVDYCHDIYEKEDGDILLVGQTSSFGNGGSDAIVIHTNSDGDIIWASTYGGAADEYGNAIVQTNNENKYAVVGNTWSFGNQSRGYIFETDEMGTSGCFESNVTLATSSPSLMTGQGGIMSLGIEGSDLDVEFSARQGIDNYACKTTSVQDYAAINFHIKPHPIVDRSIVELEADMFHSFQLFDGMGNRIQTEIILGRDQLVIEKNDLLPGWYVLEVVTKEGKKYRQKLVVQ